MPRNATTAQERYPFIVFRQFPYSSYADPEPHIVHAVDSENAMEAISSLCAFDDKLWVLSLHELNELVRQVEASTPESADAEFIERWHDPEEPHDNIRHALGILKGIEPPEGLASDSDV